MSKISKDNEGTSYPFWIIIDPAQNFKVNSDGIYNIANMITGVWFSREKAEAFLNKTRYNFSEHAKVFCASGTDSDDWVEFCKTIEKL
jgi:hypothetical protein